MTTRGKYTKNAKKITRNDTFCFTLLLLAILLRRVSPSGYLLLLESFYFGACLPAVHSQIFLKKKTEADALHRPIVYFNYSDDNK